MSGLRTKKELRELPLWQMTLSEYGWVFPEGLAAAHFTAVRDALAAGEPVDQRIIDTYPSLKTKARKRK